MEKLKEYQRELTTVIKKYQEETHAGLLLKHGLDLFITYAFDGASDKEKAYEMIQDILDQQRLHWVKYAVDKSEQNSS